MCIRWLINWSDSTKMHGATIRFTIHSISYSTTYNLQSVVSRFARFPRKDLEFSITKCSEYGWTYYDSQCSCVSQKIPTPTGNWNPVFNFAVSRLTDWAALTLALLYMTCCSFQLSNWVKRFSVGPGKASLCRRCQSPHIRESVMADT